MDKELKQWVELCLRSPSGDNCQPWILKFVNNAFYITINEKQAQHFLDQNFAASWISVGALCENLEQSAESFGFSCKCTLEDEMTVKVSYQQISKLENKVILDAITNRITFRGILNKVNFNINQYKMRPDPANQNFSWNYKNEISKETISKWAELESFLWLKTPLMKDFTKWVHISINGYLDGLTIRNLMLNVFDAIAFVILKFIPAFIHLIPFWYFKFNSKNRLNFLLNNSSGVVYLSGKFKNSNDYFFAGKEIQSMWLYLTEQGLKAQPLSIESLFFNYLGNQINHKYLSEKDLKRINSIKKDTVDTLNVTNDLIFMLRFGLSSEAIEVLPRKKLEMLLEKHIGS